MLLGIDTVTVVLPIRRRQQALRRTWQRRPDMLLTAPLTEADKQYLAQLAREYVDNDED